jgi:hypothetical protein
MKDAKHPGDSNDFRARVSRPRIGLLRELFDLLREHKKWWLAPILLSILLLGALVLLGGTAAAPFIYTLF